MELASIVTPMFWAGFILFVLAMLALDLFVLGGRTAHKVSAREALGWTGVWVTLSLSFCALLWGWLDGTAGRAVANAKALEFLTGYLIELSLSVDNIFVFIMIFSYLRRAGGVPAPGAGLWRARRHRHARHHDPGRRLAGAAVPLGAVPVRRLPGHHRFQDADLRRSRKSNLANANPISEVDAQATCASPTSTTPRSFTVVIRTARAGSRPCSWC
jgi:hypothetical protein